MPSAYEERVIKITFNPKELRILADKMERTWPKLRLGQTTFIDLFYTNERVPIHVHLDQEYFHKLAEAEAKDIA